MAQDFESNSVSAVGSTPQDTPSGADFSSDNTIIGIHMANRSQNQITASAYITSSVQEIGKDLNFFNVRVIALQIILICGNSLVGTFITFLLPDNRPNINE